MTLRPRSDEILRSVLWSFEEFIVPELSDPYAISVGHTITNLLRHLALRDALDRAIRALQAAPSESEEYAQLRARIREWIGRALAREAEWIVPAFSGIRR
jgi:hypothetical protein